MPPSDVSGTFSLHLRASQALPLTERCRLLAAPRTTSAACGWLASAKNIRRSEVVPATTLADLDHVHPEFAVFGCHFGQFRPSLHPSRILSEFISIHVGNVCEIALTADRAADLGRLTVEFGRAQQVRMRVADVGNGRVAGVHGRDGRPPGKAVIHYRSSRRHALQRTSRSPR